MSESHAKNFAFHVRTSYPEPHRHVSIRAHWLLGQRYWRVTWVGSPEVAKAVWADLHHALAPLTKSWTFHTVGFLQPPDFRLDQIRTTIEFFD